MDTNLIGGRKTALLYRTLPPSRFRSIETTGNSERSTQQVIIMIHTKEYSPPYRCSAVRYDIERTGTRPVSDHGAVSTFFHGTYSHSRYAVHAIRTELVANGYAALRVASPDTGIDLIAWNDQQILLIAAHTVRNHFTLPEIANRFGLVITSLRACPATRYTTRQLWLIRQGHPARIFTIHPGGIMEIQR